MWANWWYPFLEYHKLRIETGSRAKPRQRCETPLTQESSRNIIFKGIPTAGRQGAARSWTSEKEVKQAAGSHESKGAETAGRSTTRQAGRGGGRELQDNEGHAVSNGKPLTVGAIHPPSRCRVPFLPAPSRENGHGNGNMMEAQPSEKTRLSQHTLCF